MNKSAFRYVCCCGRWKGEICVFHPSMGDGDRAGIRDKGCGGASPIVFGPRTLGRTWGTRVDLSARNGLEGEACGIPAIVAGIEPKSAQVKTLQDSLNGLQGIKTSGEGKLQQFMALKKAKADIEQTMDAGEFRPQDRQAVLNDLNSLGPQGGGGGLRRGRS